MTAYHLEYPNLNLSVYTDVTKNIVGQIVNKDIDCAFVADFGHHPKIDKLEILRETLGLVSNAPKLQPQI